MSSNGNTVVAALIPKHKAAKKATAQPIEVAPYLWEKDQAWFFTNLATTQAASEFPMPSSPTVNAESPAQEVSAATPADCSQQSSRSLLIAWYYS